MVSGTTVHESITLDILTTLRLINGPPNFRKSLDVYRMGGNIVEVPSLPCAILVDMGADESDAEVNGLIQCTRRYDVILGVSSFDEQWPLDVQGMCADVADMLRTDWTRGGHAHTTRVEFEDVWDAPSDGDQPVAGGHVSLTVVYRHFYDDPTRAA